MLVTKIASCGHDVQNQGPSNKGTLMSLFSSILRMSHSPVVSRVEGVVSELTQETRCPGIKQLK
jgi:hypothetical protein